MYSKAFNVGYFYGRTYPRNIDIMLPEQDLVLLTNAGFKDGLEAGRNDFENIDLHVIAESADVAESA